MEDKIFNTGETASQLKAKYNPEGSTLRKAQYRMLDMLLYLDKVCKEQKIQYRLDGGNILGAVRHGGFIPWDDDVDIVVNRKDFKRLCEYLLKHPHPQYALQTPQTDEGYYNHNWNVLRDTKSEYIQDSEMHNLRKYKGVQIDIFSYENQICLPLFKLVNRTIYKHQIYWYGKSQLMTKLWFSFVDYVEIPMCRFLSALIRGNKNVYMHSYGFGDNTVFPKEILEPYKLIEFEGHLFPGPANVDAFLKAVYGNYMELPPIDKRNHHEASYKIWD